MKAEELQIVKEVAHNVRAWAEKYAAKHRHYFPVDLGGLCAIASRRIHAQLKRKGIPSTLHLYEGDWYGHCFVTVGNYVVDVTATQFRVRGKVMVIPRASAKREFWQSTKRFKSEKELLAYQRDIRWPTEQRVILK